MRRLKRILLFVFFFRSSRNTARLLTRVPFSISFRGCSELPLVVLDIESVLSFSNFEILVTLNESRRPLLYVVECTRDQKVRIYSNPGFGFRWRNRIQICQSLRTNLSRRRWPNDKRKTDMERSLSLIPGYVIYLGDMGFFVVIFAHESGEYDEYDRL
jgi:hypothetical protein